MTNNKNNQYYEGVGRRKTAIARVRIFASKKNDQTIINEKTIKEYLKTKDLIDVANAPFDAVGMKNKLTMSVKVSGGGPQGQARAIQLGLSRALVKFDGEFQKTLRDLDFLKRDPRKKERKKPGLKKARKSPQWSKR